MRLTFLVSDGLYFGEGPMATMKPEALPGPVVRGQALLEAAVALAVKSQPNKRWRGP